MSSDPKSASTFLERYLNGEVLAEEIDDYVDLWHEDPDAKEIYEFLGMTREEYSLWLRDPDMLPHVARARRERLPLAVVVRASLENLPIAARPADADKVKRLIRWLESAGKLD
jgi:capsid protein